MQLVVGMNADEPRQSRPLQVVMRQLKLKYQ